MRTGLSCGVDSLSLGLPNKVDPCGCRHVDDVDACLLTPGERQDRGDGEGFRVICPAVLVCQGVRPALPCDLVGVVRRKEIVLGVDGHQHIEVT